MRGVRRIVRRHVRCIHERRQRQVARRLPCADRRVIHGPCRALGASHAPLSEPLHLVDEVLDPQRWAHQVLVASIQEHRHAALQNRRQQRAAGRRLETVAAERRADVRAALDPCLGMHMRVHMQRFLHVLTSEVRMHRAHFGRPVHATLRHSVRVPHVVHVDAVLHATDLLPREFHNAAIDRIALVVLRTRHGVFGDRRAARIDVRLHVLMRRSMLRPDPCIHQRLDLRATLVRWIQITVPDQQATQPHWRGGVAQERICHVRYVLPGKALASEIDVRVVGIGRVHLHELLQKVHKLVGDLRQRRRIRLVRDVREPRPDRLVDIHHVGILVPRVARPRERKTTILLNPQRPQLQERTVKTRAPRPAIQPKHELAPRLLWMHGAMQHKVQVRLVLGRRLSILWRTYWYVSCLDIKAPLLLRMLPRQERHRVRRRPWHRGATSTCDTYHVQDISATLAYDADGQARQGSAAA